MRKEKVDRNEESNDPDGAADICRQEIRCFPGI